jgi:hypothetical protein
LDISLSTTAFNDAARCLKRYEYRWVDNIVPKPRDVRPALRRGVWIHRCLQLLDQGEVWQTELARMGDWAMEHDVPEEDTLALMREVYELVQDYQAYWAGHEESPGPWTTDSTEVPVEWCPRPGTRLTSTIDSLKRDRTGRLWIWERKTTQDIPDSDWRTVDPQTMLQYIEARAQGHDVAGIVFDYISTRPGPKLRVTKGGSLYSGDENRSTRARHWATTEQELRAKGAAESYINEMRSRIVSDAEWFQRYFTFRPDDNARLTLHDVASVLRQIQFAREKSYYPRAINILDCRLFCPYAKLCMHEYQTGRKSEVYREEYMTPSTDDIFAMGRTDYQ